MNLLTDEEVLFLEKETPALGDAGAEWLYFARAIEAAIIAKLGKPFAFIRGSGLEMIKLENGGTATVYASEGMSNYSTPLYRLPEL